MIVVGAGGFARQVIDILDKSDDELVFFDNTDHAPDAFLEIFPVIKTIEAASQHLRTDRKFCIAVGGPANRQKLYDLFISMGGEASNIIAPSAIISKFNVEIGSATCLLNNVVVEPNVKIGKGCAINISVNITHDCEVGDFCELGPAVTLCGNVRLANNVFIGAGATVLPRITIGDNCIIGAGALVNRDVPSNTKVVGVPAR